MVESHASLRISADEWAAFMGDLDQTLTRFAVPERERGEVVAIVESTKSDIVTAAPATV
jgi:hypothetical protein